MARKKLDELTPKGVLLLARTNPSALIEKVEDYLFAKVGDHLIMSNKREQFHMWTIKSIELSRDNLKSVSGDTFDTLFKVLNIYVELVLQSGDRDELITIFPSQRVYPEWIRYTDFSTARKIPDNKYLEVMSQVIKLNSEYKKLRKKAVKLSNI